MRGRAISAATAAQWWMVSLSASGFQLCEKIGAAAGREELLALLRARVLVPEQLLVVLEATGVLHLNWSAALTQAGYAVVVINPLIARRFYPLENES